jgi:hypothetical protein
VAGCRGTLCDDEGPRGFRTAFEVDGFFDDTAFEGLEDDFVDLLDGFLWLD